MTARGKPRKKVEAWSVDEYEDPTLVDEAQAINYVRRYSSLVVDTPKNAIQNVFEIAIIYIVRLMTWEKICDDGEVGGDVEVIMMLTR